MQEKAIRTKIESEFEKYRLCKYLSDDESDAHQITEYRAYCERIERFVSKLPTLEQKLVQERYMTNEGQYITDYEVYTDKLRIGNMTYARARNRAFESLYLALFQ